jgi:DNA-binding GntR family transcriptional regulator
MSNQTDMIVAHIVKRIEDGTLSPGDVLEEKALVSEFGLSRTPVREALLQLDAVGILRRKARGGAEVFQPTLEEFLAILEVHAKLEGHAAALAARRMSADDAAALERACASCDHHVATLANTMPNAYYQHNLSFHKTVGLAAHNPFLMEMIRTNGRKLLAYYRARYAYKGSIPQSAIEHRKIAALIVDRDVAGAEEAMVRHVTFDSVTAMDLIAMLSKSRSSSG